MIAGVAAVAIAVVAGKLWSSGVFPTSINFSLHDPVNQVVDWCRNHLRNGVPIIHRRPGSPIITTADVKRLQEDEYDE